MKVVGASEGSVYKIYSYTYVTNCNVKTSMERSELSLSVCVASQSGAVVAAAAAAITDQSLTVNPTVLLSASLPTCLPPSLPGWLRHAV